MSAVGWKMETCLAAFTNADELVKLFRSSADVINPEEVDLPRPALKGGKPQTVQVAPTPATASYMQYLVQWYRNWTQLPGREKREQSHVPLVINGLARRAALDLRLVDPTAADDRGSKVNRAVQEMLRIYRDTAHFKGTQVVFAENNHSEDEQGHKFSLWDDVRDKLVAGGVDPAEIASIYDHDTKKARPLLFDQVNEGKVRFVFGSTDKLGVGVNVQRLLAACTTSTRRGGRPTSSSVRAGIIRQGNTLMDLGIPVEILRYGTENTLDAGMWQRLSMKQKFINQVLRGAGPRPATFEDAGSDVVMSFEEAAALVSGNPLVMEKIENEAPAAQLTAGYQHDQGAIDARQSWPVGRGPAGGRADAEGAAGRTGRADRAGRAEGPDAAVRRQGVRRPRGRRHRSSTPWPSG